MERIYHRLVAEGNAAADDAEALDMEFWQGFGSAEHAIYAGMLRELAEEGSIHGRALVEALLAAGFSASKLARSDEARTLALAGTRGGPARCQCGGGCGWTGLVSVWRGADALHRGRDRG